MSPQSVIVPSAVIVPTWISIGLGEIGVREDLRVGQSNLRIQRYHGITGAGEAPDDVAWCASFVGWCLEMAGVKSTRNKTAASYATYGVASLFRFGCLAFADSTDPDAKSTGHVGFGLGLSGNTLFLLGGNQQQAKSAWEPEAWQGVSIAMRDARKFRYRWPAAIPVA